MVLTRTRSCNENRIKSSLATDATPTISYNAIAKDKRTKQVYIGSKENLLGWIGDGVTMKARDMPENARIFNMWVEIALAGACLVLIADSAVRVLPFVTELRLGIALSLIGAPFFLWLLLRMRKGKL